MTSQDDAETDQEPRRIGRRRRFLTRWVVRLGNAAQRARQQFLGGTRDHNNETQIDPRPDNRPGAAATRDEDPLPTSPLNILAAPGRAPTMDAIVNPEPGSPPPSYWAVQPHSQSNRLAPLEPSISDHPNDLDDVANSFLNVHHGDLPPPYSPVRDIQTESQSDKPPRSQSSMADTQDNVDHTLHVTDGFFNAHNGSRPSSSRQTIEPRDATDNTRQQNGQPIERERSRSRKDGQGR